jgi:hypothetical protein
MVRSSESKRRGVKGGASEVHSWRDGQSEVTEVDGPESQIVESMALFRMCFFSRNECIFLTVEFCSTFSIRRTFPQFVERSSVFQVRTRSESVKLENRFIYRDLLIGASGRSSAKQLYTSGPIAHETEVSRILGYSSAQSQSEFKWAKQRIRKVMELHDNPSSAFESIASKLGCDADEVRVMFHRELQIGAHENCERFSTVSVFSSGRPLSIFAPLYYYFKSQNIFEVNLPSGIGDLLLC